jgi:hypothetical protein
LTTLFENSHDALVFAFNFSSQQYGVSEMARLAGPMASSGKGLIGMDGAAQAGMIMREVDAVGKENPLHKACIVAIYSPKFKECPCCKSDRMPIQNYQEAVATLREKSADWISGISKRNMREAIIRAHYERGVSLKKEAERLKVPTSSAYDQKSVIMEKLIKLENEARGAIFERLNRMCGFD